MGKKHLKLWLLIMCAVIALGLFAGCKKKKAKPTEAPTTTTAATETTTESSKETAEPTTAAPTTTTAAPTTEATTESTTEATTEATKETTEATKKTKDTTPTTTAPLIDENGTYTSKDDVALYIYTYGHLPSNFVTKKEAQAKGWEGGSLEDYFPGASIGGDRFGNYEGQLPEKNGRKYRECDIDFDGGYRGSKRIIYSSDGLIYYTEDHYKTFERLY